MKLNRITEMARRAIDKRGGMNALKRDLQEARHAVAGRGSWKDKARAAAGALRTPGRGHAADRGADAAGEQRSGQRPPTEPPADT